MINIFLTLAYFSGSAQHSLSNHSAIDYISCPCELIASFCRPQQNFSCNLKLFFPLNRFMHPIEDGPYGFFSSFFQNHFQLAGELTRLALSVLIFPFVPSWVRTLFLWLILLYVLQNSLGLLSRLRHLYSQTRYRARVQVDIDVFFENPMNSRF